MNFKKRQQRVNPISRAYGRGQNVFVEFQVKTARNGKVLDTIPVEFSNIWTEYAAHIGIPSGVQALYFTYRGSGSASLGSFILEVSRSQEG